MEDFTNLKIETFKTKDVRENREEEFWLNTIVSDVK